MLGDFLLDPVSSPDEKLVRSALRDYFRLKSAQDLGEGVVSGIFGGDSLGKENQRLDIELKKRQLSAMGPQDTESFNNTPTRRVLAALGINWGNSLDAANGVKSTARSAGPAARAGIGAAKDSGFFKIAHAVPEAMELGDVASSFGGGARRSSRILGAFL